jgi:hypothetical protein
MAMKLAASILAVIALTACKKQLDTVGYEKKLRSELEAKGITADKVTCPKDIKAKKGETFTCQITIEGKDYGFEATIGNIDGDKVDMTTRWVDGQGIIGNKLESALPAQLTEALGAAATVDCGEPLRFVDADGKVTCKTTVEGQTYDLKIAFDDKSVSTGWEMVPEPVVRARLLETVTPSVQGKLGTGVAVSCGDKALLAVPADGVLWCELSEGAKQAKLKLSFKPGTTQLDRWEVVE